MKNAIGAVVVLPVGCALAGGLAVGAAEAQYLLVPDSTEDRVIALDAVTGAVVNPNFIDVATPAAAAGVTSTPIEALQIGNEIWVSDQVADRVWRFDLDGGLLGDIGAGELNNIRGMDRIGDTVYVAMGSDGTTLGEGIVTIDVPTLAVTGVFNGRDPADTSYWDVLAYNGELLVSNSDGGNDGIERYDTAGNYLGNLVSSDGLTSFDFVQQIATNAAGNFLLASFSAPAGVYEVQPDGTNLGIVAADAFGPRGVFELPGGDILWTNGANIRTDTEFFADDGSFRFINPSTVPEPASLLAMVVGLAVFTQRRR